MFILTIYTITYGNLLFSIKQHEFIIHPSDFAMESKGNFNYLSNARNIRNSSHQNIIYFEDKLEIVKGIKIFITTFYSIWSKYTYVWKYDYGTQQR